MSRNSEGRNPQYYIHVIYTAAADRSIDYIYIYEPLYCVKGVWRAEFDGAISTGFTIPQGEVYGVRIIIIITR